MINIYLVYNDPNRRRYMRVYSDRAEAERDFKYVAINHEDLKFSMLRDGTKVLKRKRHTK